MTLIPHLSYDGRCEAAFRFHEKWLGASLPALLPNGAAPMAAEAPPRWRGKIVHASVKVDSDLLAGAGLPPERFQRPQAFHVLFAIGGPEQGERVFAASAENGTVHLPIQQTFWAARFGVLTGQFGISWEINCEPVPSFPTAG